MPTTRRDPHTSRRDAVAVRPRGHLHWYRWVGEDPAGAAGLYACRCGDVRPGM